VKLLTCYTIIKNATKPENKPILCLPISANAAIATAENETKENVQSLQMKTILVEL